MQSLPQNDPLEVSSDSFLGLQKMLNTLSYASCMHFLAFFDAAIDGCSSMMATKNQCFEAIPSLKAGW